MTMEGIVVKHVDTQKELYCLSAVDGFSRLQGVTEDSVSFLIDHLRTIRWDELKDLRKHVALEGDDLNRLISLGCPLKLNYRVVLLNTFFEMVNFNLTDETKNALLEFHGDEKILTRLCGVINLSPLSDELKNKLALKMMRGEYDGDELDPLPRNTTLPSPPVNPSPLRREWTRSPSSETTNHLLENTAGSFYESGKTGKVAAPMRGLGVHSPSCPCATGKRTQSEVPQARHTLSQRPKSDNPALPFKFSSLPTPRGTPSMKRSDPGYPVKKSKVSYEERHEGAESTVVCVPNSDDAQPTKPSGQYYVDDSDGEED